MGDDVDVEATTGRCELAVLEHGLRAVPYLHEESHRAVKGVSDGLAYRGRHLFAVEGRGGFVGVKQPQVPWPKCGEAGVGSQDGEEALGWTRESTTGFVPGVLRPIPEAVGGVSVMV